LDNEWLKGWWSTLQFPLSIAYKEPFPVVLVAHVWGPGWSGRCILVHVDNKAAVHILNSWRSADPNIMHLLHSLLKAAICFSVTFTAIHVPGRNNDIADALSHFNFQAFHSQAPHAKMFPVLILPQLLTQLSSNILCLIYSAFDFNFFDDVVFWAACLLAYFRRLCALSKLSSPT